MKKSVFIILMVGALALFESSTAFAQTRFTFTYDGSGNRTGRVIVLSQAASTNLSPETTAEVITDQLEDQQIRIYPNPAAGLLKLDFSSVSASGTILKVYDSKTRLLVNRQAQKTGNELSFCEYSPGSYILVIQSGEKKQEWKIIKNS